LLSEAVAIKQALEPAMKAEAERRMKAGKPSVTVTEGQKGDCRDKAAALTGRSARTMRAIACQRED